MSSWILRHKVKRFFLSKFEFRARSEKGLIKDRIYRAVFTKTLEDAFDEKEIKELLKEKVIRKDQIILDRQVKNIYFWLEQECEWQPVWHKRMIQKFFNWIRA